MSDDAIIGYDGRARCAWAGAGDTASSHYHDEVWGTRTYDEPAMFEALTLGVFEAGLSWSIVFGKRDGFRDVFRNFNVAKARSFTPGATRRAAESWTCPADVMASALGPSCPDRTRHARAVVRALAGTAP
jgi:hypothetical protein